MILKKNKNKKRGGAQYRLCCSLMVWAQSTRVGIHFTPENHLMSFTPHPHPPICFISGFLNRSWYLLWTPPSTYFRAFFFSLLLQTGFLKSLVERRTTRDESEDGILSIRCAFTPQTSISPAFAALCHPPTVQWVLARVKTQQGHLTAANSSYSLLSAPQ